MRLIHCLNNISAQGTDLLDPKAYSLTDSLDEAEGILVRSAAMHDMKFPAGLRAIARAGAGVNNIPLDRCADEGIVVFNTPGANANAVKEIVLCALLLGSRDILGGIEWCRENADDENITKAAEKAKKKFAGQEIKGKKLGVIGLGAIGGLVANAAHSLGMEVYGFDPFLSVDAAWGLSRGVRHAVSREQIFAECDYITVHTPLTPETKDMFCAASFATMKDGVRILNFARAELVNAADMKEALASGKVAAYVVDFPTDEVLGVPGVIAIPHLGASTPESEDNCAVMAVDELKAYLEDGVIRNSVNFPSVDVPRSTDHRLCVLHRNIPNMLTGISGAVSAEGINIETMTNRSKKDYAYTILDVVGDPSDESLDKIRAIDGVIRLRKI